MGPNYHRPEIAQPNEFRFQISQTDAASFADLRLVGACSRTRHSKR